MKYQPIFVASGPTGLDRKTNNQRIFQYLLAEKDYDIPE